MKNLTEQEYVNELIKQYSNTTSASRYDIVIECAKIDVQNTIDALTNSHLIKRYTKVLTILNDMK